APAAWQFPECCQARIEYGGIEVATSGWRASPWTQSAGVATREGPGRVDGAYTEPPPAAAPGPLPAPAKTPAHTGAPISGRPPAVAQAPPRARGPRRDAHARAEPEPAAAAGAGAAARRPRPHGGPRHALAADGAGRAPRPAPLARGGRTGGRARRRAGGSGR